MHTHNLMRYVLNRFAMRLGFVVLLFLGISIDAFSQANVPVCRDGVVRLESFLLDNLNTYTGVKVPPGHLSKGYWSNTAGLTLSNINDANAIISGFDGVAPGTTYTLTWYHGIDQTYDITIEVTNNISPEYELHNEDGNTDNVLFCKSPNKYQFTVVPSDANPGAAIVEVDYMIYHANGSSNEIDGVGNPADFNLNASIGYKDLDIFHALVSNGTCLDITTNTIQLAEISSVVVQIQGGKSACDPSIFDGSHVLEVLPYDSNNFNYQWQLNGVNIVGATNSTYTLVDPVPGLGSGVGEYTVVVVEKSNACGPFITTPVIVSNTALPEIYINDSPTGSGRFEICESTLAANLTTTLDFSGGGVLPGALDYDWYQNGSLVQGSLAAYFINNDETSLNYNAFGDYHVVLKDANNIECKSTSPPVSVKVIRLDAATVVKNNNATPFCLTGVPEVKVTVTGGTAPYTLTFRDDKGNPAFTRTLAVNGGVVSLPSISVDTQFTLIGVRQNSSGCEWAGAELTAFQVYTSPAILPITGNDACVPTNSVNLTLVAPEDGITYQLKRDNDGDGVYDDNIGVAITYQAGITPIPLSWSGYTTAGTYKVFASTSTCLYVPMDNEYVATPEPKDIPLNLIGTVCPSGEVSIGTKANPVDASVDYVLLHNNMPILTRPGSVAVDGVLSFGDRNVEGLYEVRAVSGSCVTKVTGSLQVYEVPLVLNLSANKTKYCATEPSSNVNITLSGVESTAGYQLQRQNGASWDNVGGIRYGADGDDIIWLNQTEGVYRVMASSIGGACSIEMRNRINVEVVVEPTAAISVIMPNRRCANVNGNFTINVILTGNAPYNFDIYDDKGNRIVQETGVNLGTYTLTVNPSDAQTIYHIENLTDAASCSPVSPVGTATVFIDPVPTIKFSPASPEVCIGSSINISADGAGPGGTYVWSDGLGANQSITVAPSVTDDYTVTATTNQGCIASEDVEVVVNPLPVLDFNTPGDIYEYCENDGLVSLTGNQAGATFSGSGVALGGGFFNPDPASTDPLIPVKASVGNNTITYQYTNTKGCFNKISKTIVVNPLPVVQLNGLANSYCADAGVVTFNATPNGSAPGSTGSFSITGYDAGPHKGGWWNQDAAAGNGAWINVGAALTALGQTDIEVCYTYENANDCERTVCQTVTLLPNYDADLSFTGLPATVCETGAVVTLTPYLAGIQLVPAVGTSISFSGPGTSITNNADGTASFDPAAAGAGDHTITLHYEDVNGCRGTVSQDIQVGTPLNVLNLTSNYCSSDDNDYLLVGQVNNVTPDPATTPTWFDVIDPKGNIIALNQPNGVYNLIPSVLFQNHGAGTYQVVYKYIDDTGCANTLTSEVEIIEELNAIFTIGGLPYATAQANYCVNDNAAVLNGHADLEDKAIGNVSSVFTGNGVSGTGIVGGAFKPGHSSVLFQPNANTISHTVIHTVNGKSCPSPVETFDVFVTPVNASIDGLQDEYCSSTELATISANELDVSKVKATFTATINGNATAFLKDNGDNTADIYPSVGSGIYKVTMHYTQLGDGCDTLITKWVEVLAADPVTFSGVNNDQKICLSSSPITLRGAMPSGGVGNFSIIPDVAGGVTNTGTDDLGNPVVLDDGIGILNPGALAIGPYTIRYEYTNGAGCSTWAEKNIEIVGAPTNLFDLIVEDKNGNAFSAYCSDDVAPNRGVKIGLSGSNSGVTYELLLGGKSIQPNKVEFVGGGTSFYFEDASGDEILFSNEGVYTVKAAQNSCDAIMNKSVRVEQYELVLQLVSKVDVGCSGASDGEAVLKTTGGSGTYEYSKDGGATWQASDKFTGLAAGDHNFSVRDLSSAACEKLNELTVKIAEPAALTVTEDVTLNSKVGCEPCTAGVDCEGSATIHISGGTPDYITYPGVGYQISWSTGGTDFTETGMPAGLHTVSVTDGNGCKQTVNINIQVNDNLALVEDVDPALHINNKCNGASKGSYVLSANGGSGKYQFAFSDPAIAPTTWQESNYGANGNQYQVKDLAAGTYNTVWVRDGNARYDRCYVQLSAPVIISEPTALSLTEESKSEITCNGAVDGSFVVKAFGGSSGTYQFSQTNPALGGAVWNDASNGVDNYQVTGVGAGVHTVWMRDKDNVDCSYVSVDVTLNNVDKLDFDIIQHKNVSCNLGNDGRLEVLAKGGSGNYVYQWEDQDGNPVAGTQSVDNLKAGSYTVTISDVKPNSCGSVTHSFVVTEPTELIINLISNIPADCDSENSGSLTIDVTGGSPDYVTYPGVGYKIDWSLPASQTENISNLSAGDYVVNVEDGNGCSKNSTYTVLVLDDITLASPAIVKHNDCHAAHAGSIQVQVTGGPGAAAGNYQFRLEGAQIVDWSNAVSAPFDNFTFDNLSAGVYQVLVRDANNTGCEYPLGTFTITHPDALGLLTTQTSDVTCFGEADGSVTVRASGGSGTYQFSVDNGLWTGGDLPESYTHTGLSAGEHTVWVRDSKASTCVFKLMPSVSIQQPDRVTLDIMSYKNVSCFQANDGVVELTASGGSGNYDYYISSRGWIVGTGPTHTFKDLPAGAYTFMVRDHDVPTCAMDSENHQITQPLDFAVDSHAAVDVQCKGEANGQITIDTKYSDGTNGVFTYSINNGSTWSPSPVTNLLAGTYVISIKDNSTGCIQYDAIAGGVTIAEPAEALLIGKEWIADVNCYGESNGSIDLQGNVTGGTAPYDYVWYKMGAPDVIVSTGDDKADGLAYGEYYVKVTDSKGCLSTSTPNYTVNQPAAWDVQFSTKSLTAYNSEDGVINIHTHIGGNKDLQVKWYSYDGTTETYLAALDNMWIVNTFDAGTYRFKITDNKACEYISEDITLTAPYEFVVKDPNTTKKEVSCFAGANGVIDIQVVSGSSDYNINVVGTLVNGEPDYIEDKDFSTKTYVLDQLKAGSYAITVTDKNTSEVYQTTVVISQPSELTVVESVTDISCNGQNDGALSVDITGHIVGATISWTGDNGYAAGPELLDVATKSYAKSDLKPGNYVLTVNNNNACPATIVKGIAITEPNPWLVHSSVIHVTSFGNNNGAVQVDFPPTGNTAPYTIAWDDDPSTSWSRSGLSAGSYTYTITDNTGKCTYSQTLTVEQPAQLLFDLTGSDATCYGYNNGSIGVDITSGNADYNIVLSGTEFDGNVIADIPINGNATGSHVFRDLKAGAYEVVVADAKGEILSKSITIDHLAEISVDLVSSKEITCNKGSDGEIEVELTGRGIDETKATINWTRTNPTGWSVSGKVNAEKSQTGLIAGTYIIHVADQFGCSATPLSLTLSEPKEISATEDVAHVTTNGASDGRIFINNVESENGVASVMWNIKDGVGNFVPFEKVPGTPFTGYDNASIGAGVYQYVITDNNGCTFISADIPVTEPGELIVAFNKTNINCFGANNGIISAIITSGTAPYKTVLTGIPTDGSGFTSVNSALTHPVFSGLKPGVYTATTTDNAGQTRSETITLTQNTETKLVPTISDIQCYGAGDGTIGMALAGNVSNPAVELWQVIDPNGATVYSGALKDNATQPALLAGEYQVIVTNQQGCKITDTYTIAEPVDWNVHHTISPVTPTGNNNGVINIDVLSGSTPFAVVPNYKISWTGPAGVTLVADQRLQTGLVAGTYTYHIEDANGCTYDSEEIVILEPAAIAATVSQSDVDILCYGDAKGHISVNILSGNEPYTIHLTGNQYDGIAFGDKQVVNSNTGSYLWDKLKAGEYQIQIVDHVGNVFDQDAIVLTQPDENVIVSAPADLSCNAADKGASEIAITLNRNFVAGDKVVWSGPAGIMDNGPLSLVSGVDKIKVYKGGDYTYTFVDGNGCAITETLVIAEPDPFTIDWDDEDATVYELNDGIINVHSVSGSNGLPYTISWMDNGVASTVTDFLRTDLLAGTYSFTIQDANGCDTTITDIIIGQPKPLTVVVTPKDALCYDDANGEIKVEFTSHNGGYTYQITGNQDDGDAYDSGRITPTTISSKVTGLKAGTYLIHAYDSKGTHYQKDNIRIEQEPQVSLSAGIKDISCFGAADGAVTVSLNGRLPLASDIISWEGTKGTFVKGALYDEVTAKVINNTIDPVHTAETFLVTVNSAKGCKYTKTFEVKEPKELVVTLTNVEDVTCANGNDGSIEAVVSGRAGGSYQYDWYKHDGTDYQVFKLNGAATVNKLFAGNYQLIVTSLGDGCQVIEKDIIVENGSQIIINETISDVTTCVGDNSGVITVSVENGLSPYTVKLSGQPTQTGDGNAAFVFNTLTAGNYLIEVSDARGNSCAVATKNVVVAEPAVAFEVSELKHHIECDVLQSTSGTFSFDITGGNAVGGNYKYQILLPEASITKPVTLAVGATHTETVDQLAAGTYHLTVLDLNSTDPATCALTYQFTLEHIVITSNPVVNTTCKGINNGAISGINVEGASANYTYNWSTTDGGIGLDNTTLNQSGLSVGTYILEVLDADRGGCSVTKEFKVAVDHTITIEPTIKDVSCNGGSDGAIQLEVGGVSPATSYLWTGPGITTNNLQNQVDLIAGNYKVELTSVMDGQTCKADAVYKVAQPNPITYVAKFEYTDCDPYERTLVLEHVSGGKGNYTYLWDGPAFSPAVPADPTRVTIYQGGSYAITVKDENQCAKTNTVLVPHEISIDPIVNPVTCNGGDNGSIVLNVAGGTGAFDFKWTGPAGFTSSDRNIDNLFAGVYTVIITDLNEKDAAGSCFRTYDIEITAPKPIVIDPTVVNTSCFGKSDGKIEIEVSGGTAPYTYHWSPVVGTNLSSERNQYNLPADNYNVTVTDANGCTKTLNIPVTQDAQINLSTLVTETQCDGTAGAIDLTVTGGSGNGFSYKWSSASGLGLVQDNEDQSGLSGGTYTVVVSDLGIGRSCTETISATITHAIEVINETVTPVTCSGNDDGTISYDVIGGDGNYTYSWNVISGDPTRVVVDAQNQSGLSEGEYEVTITDGRSVGATNCAITKTFTVSASTGLKVNVAVSDSKMCFGEPGGKLVAAVSGGSGDYTYYWNGVKGTAVLDNQIQGIYGLKVVDNLLGCDFVQSYEIKGPKAPLSIDHILVTDVLCYNENTGAIEVTVSGGTMPATGDYIYTWTGGATAATGSHPTNLFAGTYNLTVTDDNGCTITSGDIVIKQPGSHIKVDSPLITDVSVPSGADGQIWVDVYDGVAPRSVEWFNAADASVGVLNPLTGLTAGTYRVVATDANGCSAELSGIRVVEPGEALGLEKTVHQISPCSGADNGEIHINRVYGGFALADDNYRIQVSGPGVNKDVNATSLSLTGLAPGTYRVVVFDAVPVSYQEDIVIGEYAPLTLTTTKVQDVNCFGASTGQIEVVVGGGKPNASNHYLVEISSAQGYAAFKENAQANTAFRFSNLPAGNYKITVMDHADDFDTKVPDRAYCELSDYTLITEPSANVELTSVSGESDICVGDSYNLAINTSNWNFTTQGNIKVAVYDDFATTEYIVDQSPFVITVNPTSSRTYEISKVFSLSDASCLQGQTTGKQVQLTVHELPTAHINGPTEVCEDGTVQLSVSFTGTQPFSFTWRDINNKTSNTITDINTNTYTFTDTPVSNASYIVERVSDDIGCSHIGNGQVDVVINEKPKVTLTGGTDICVGNSATLQVGLVKGMNPYTITYKANGKEGTMVISPAGAVYDWVVSPELTTEYEIISVIDGKGCQMDFPSRVWVKVTVNPLPDNLAAIVSNTDLGAVCQGAKDVDYAIAAVNNATTYRWTVGAGMNIVTGNGTTAIRVNFDRSFTGGYVRVYAENECGTSPVVEHWVNATRLPDAIMVAPSGPTDICEGESGLIYTIPPALNAASYQWDIPAGLIVVGDANGTSIQVDVDPNVPFTIGDIRVRPINACGDNEPWSPALTIAITPLPTPDAGADDRICGSSYTLAGSALKANESGRWTIAKGAGQFANAAIDAARPDARITNLSQGSNVFVWTVTNTKTGCESSDEVTIYNDQLTVNAAADQYTVCDGTVNLSGTALSSLDAPGGSGLWSTPDGAMIIPADTENTTATNLAPGENTFTWTIRKGSCFSSASVKVINNKPSDAIIYNAADVIISQQDLPCGDNFTSLKGSVPAADETGYWRIEAGNVTIDDSYNSTIHISNIPAGDHILSWNILSGSCISQEFVTIRNNSFVVDAGKDEFTCDGSIWLHGTEAKDGAVGEWIVIEGSGSFDDAYSANTMVRNLDQANDGRNVFRWTIRRNGCESFDEVVMSNNQPSEAQMNGDITGATICDYTYKLNALAPAYGQGIWTVVSGKGSFEDRTVHNTSVTGIQNGDNVYRWTVYNNTCSSSVDFTVTNMHVNAYAGADTAVCGPVAYLHATPAPQGATATWAVVSGMGGGGFRPSAEDPNARIESLTSGNNQLVWKVTNGGCVTTDTIIVSNNAPTPVSATPKITTDDSYTTLIAENPIEGSGVWTLLEGKGTIINPTSPTTRVEGLFPNINRFRWTVTKLNCSDYVDVEVQSGALAQAEAGWDQLDLCEDFTKLQANLPENTYGEWTVEKGGVKFENNEYNNPRVSIYNINPGRNVLRWTLRFVGNGTQSTTDTVVIINKKPSVAWGGYDITVCGNEAKLEGKAPIYGIPSWTVLSGGGSFSDSNDPKAEVTGLAPGENIIKYEIINDVCFSYDTISVFNMEASEADAGEDQIVCADSAEIKPTIPKYGIGTWRVIKGAGKGKDNKGNYTNQIEGNYVYDLAPGENILVWEVQVPGAAAECIQRDSITIINNQPSLAFAGADRPICTDTVTLSGSVPIYGVGTWTLISGSGEIADSSKTNTLVHNVGLGKNRFRWTIDNKGCTSVSDVEISNNLIEALAGYEQINCADTAVLQANNPAPGVGNWGIVGGSGSAKFDDNSNPYTNVRELDKGENLLTWTINYKGCRSVSEVKVINNQPSTADAGDNKATCVNTLMLGASNPEVGTGIWTIQSGGGKFVDDLNAATRVDSLKFGDNIFRWTVEHQGCTSEDDVQISFNKIEAKAGGNLDICSDRTFLEANSAKPGIGTWTVVGGGSQAKFVDSHDAVTEVFDLAKGRNRLMWSINNKGCVTSSEVEVINHTPSTAYAGNTQELCEDFTIMDATPVSIGKGRWEILTGSAIITDTEIVKPKAQISGLSKGENVLRWIVTSDNGLCSSQDEVSVFNNLPSEPYAGKDEEYCSPTVVLKAAVPDFGTGQWSIIQGGGDFNNPSLPHATISNLQEGVNVLRWTITHGNCSLSSDIEVINNTPTTANAGPDINDCKNYAPLDANVATQGNGYWTLVSGYANFNDASNPKTRVDNLTFGENILMWNIKKGECISSDEMIVTNNIPDQAKAGADKETCEDYLTLNANDPTSGVGTWHVLSGHGNFDDAHSPTTIIRDLELGENKLKWVVSYGSCTTEDVVEIISNKADPYAGEDDVSYEPSYELKASNPGKLGAVWSVVAGVGSFEDETFYNTRVNGLKEGINTFRWLMDINGCVTSDDVSIEYKVVPDAAFKVDTFQGCYPLTIQFTNQSIGGSTYYWEFGDGKSSTTRNPVHTFRDPGEYTVTLVAPGPDNVDGTYQKQIIVHDHPTADFTYGPDVLYVPGDVLRCYSSSVDADRYLWDFGDGGTSTQVNPAYKYSDIGNYTITLQVTSSNNCVDEMVKVNAVNVKAQGFVVYPNSFMPRPDGGSSSSVGGSETNTVFRPVYKDVETYSLQIFNRWGQLIYEGQDIDEGWNGFFNSQLSPQGVYVWKATGTFISGKEFNEAGSVLLVR